MARVRERGFQRGPVSALPAWISAVLAGGHLLAIRDGQLIAVIDGPLVGRRWTPSTAALALPHHRRANRA